MKIRTGFVSNSSSSSFIVAFKGELREELKKAFKLPDNHPIKEFDVSGNILKLIDQTFTSQKDMTQYVRDNYEPENYDKIQKYLDEGYQVSTGSFSSDSDDDMERILCNLDIDFKSENLIIGNWGY